MKSMLYAGACFLALFPSPRLFSAPLDEAKAILKDFLDQPNYTWATTSSRGMPEEKTGSVGQDTDGQHEKNGYTKINFVKGPHIPPDKPATRPWPGITDQSDFWSSHWVYETPDGWEKLGNLPNPNQPGPPTRTRSRSTGTPLIEIPLVHVGTSASYRRTGAWRPDLEVAIIIENIADVEKTAGGVYEITLTPEGATLLASWPVPPFPFVSIRFENISGSVKLWTRDGAITGYKLEIEATAASFGGGRPVAINRVRDLKDLGTTVIEIPEEAKKLLGL